MEGLGVIAWLVLCHSRVGGALLRRPVKPTVSPRGLTYSTGHFWFCRIY
ncbi:MAG TPA: hypothetical protein LFV92_03910 [Rickettsia endosymbiont of Ceroptres masudai]|nr:hypothetical protein [Rickettsia endosymbiont of Ceroptres masudai]